MAWVETHTGLAVLLAMVAVLAAWTGYVIGHGLAQNARAVVVVLVQH